MRIGQFCLAVLAGAWGSIAAAGPAAFPGAEGFGASATGGRGGEVYEVTTLADSGPGSLRDAVSKPDRTVVFRVAGTIALKSAVVVKVNNITIAGQTAPGDGICLRDNYLGVSGRNVIVRYVRSRLGDEQGKENDCIDLLHGARNVIIDHCSATWSVDECLSLSGDVQDCTVQWCLIGEALNKSKHAKGPHGYGSLSRANGGVTWHHNLWVHNNARNPRLGDNYGRGSSPTFDVRNNVVYDYGGTCTGLTQGKFTANYVGNYLRPGPSSKAQSPISIGGPSDLQFFIRDNIWEGHESLDNEQFFRPVEIGGKRQVRPVEEPFATPPVHTTGAKEAYEAVLAGVGATLPKRDAVDERIINNVRNRGGRMIDSQKEVGGWPEYQGATPPSDSDHDGMPDEWEVKHGFNPRDPADGKLDANGDGYTNLEEYLNGTDPRAKKA